MTILKLIILGTFIIFFLGVLVGCRCQEINLRQREQRLAEERRWVDDQLCALNAYQQVNILISQAQKQLGRHALLQADTGRSLGLLARSTTVSNTAPGQQPALTGAHTDTVFQVGPAGGPGFDR